MNPVNVQSLMSVYALQLTRAALHQLPSESDQGRLCHHMLIHMSIKHMLIHMSLMPQDEPPENRMVYECQHFVISLLNMTIVTSGCQAI